MRKSLDTRKNYYTGYRKITTLVIGKHQRKMTEEVEVLYNACHKLRNTNF